MKPRETLGSIVLASALLLPLSACSRDSDAGSRTGNDPASPEVNIHAGMDLSDLSVNGQPATSHMRNSSNSSSAASPVIVTSNEVTPLSDEESQQVGNFIQYLDEYLTINRVHPELTDLGAFEQVRRQVKLPPSQILVVGKSDGYHLINLTDSDYFTAANNLAIHRLRSKLTLPDSPKDPFETTIQYQRRLQAEQARINQAGQRQQVDLKLMEGVLNYYGKRQILTTGNESREEYSSTHYDADSQTLILETEAATSYATQRQASLTARFIITLSCPAEQARTLLADGAIIGFILSYQNQQLSLEKIAIFTRGLTNAPILLGQFVPKKMVLQQISNSGATRDISVPIGQPVPFHFGIQSYQPPRSKP